MGCDMEELQRSDVQPYERLTSGGIMGDSLRVFPGQHYRLECPKLGESLDRESLKKECRESLKFFSQLSGHLRRASQSSTLIQSSYTYWRRAVVHF